ncbi:zinc dependent phospholipase C family protein [Thermoflavimicrobium daqui]|uniref:Phospholipase C/D domain-containing protein n=1 Tax=Thermoflavimicrobium daqui TaxID=2137476 RepID=A0A364K5N4_9BACL|nr:zinc dependent phospholipase C family protein [Thermoflavimicrobium daqui]RAL25578.1 hypothetical protein DL897_05720 [Thermoflavimicrobium daqui]
MPYAWTHIIFGRELIRLSILPQPNNKPLFQLGCQGPDFFFFHRFWQLTRKTPSQELGNLFHTQSCGPVLIELIEAAKKHPDLREYVAGFLTHYILDSSTHPYIHYRAGYKRFKHQKLEVIMDTIIAMKISQLETWSTSLTPEIDIGHFPQNLTESFHKIVQKFYPTLAKEVEINIYDAAYQDMKKAFQLFFDPYGFKLIFTFGMIAPFRHTKNIPSKDFLNLNQTSWNHPAIADEVHHESFWDLWENALLEGKHILPNILEYWETGRKPDTSFSQLLGNRSYDTGKDCTLNLNNFLCDPLV